jgi:polyphosphate kinase
MGASAHKASRRIRKRDAISIEAPGAEIPDLDDPSLYLNRELSLLAFQRRVLEEAEDPGNPLLERIKFLSIVGSNLDEFFMVRVAGLLEQVDAGIAEVGADGITPKAKLTSIRREVKRLSADAHRCLEGSLLPALEEAGIFIRDFKDLTAAQAAVATKYFTETVFPVLTPLAFDPGRPFPHISNLSLNLAVIIRDGGGEEHFARVKIPGTLPQLVPLTKTGAARSAHRRPPRRTELVWIEQLIAANLQSLFPGMEVVEAHPFHVTRDADIEIKELEAEDLLETVEEGLRQRRFGSVVRLMVSSDMPRHMLKILMSNLEIDGTEVYKVQGPLGRVRLMSLYRLDRPELKDPPFVPVLPERLVPKSETDDAFSMIRRQDILLHHPFDSFQPVIEFLRAAAADENVLALKMVLYRVGRNSPIVDALLEAIKNGKQVAVMVELKARFDEESNIEWARKLEREGVHVVYGLLGLKIHCKVALVVRQEERHIQRYVHLATGNYNALTAHTYTDIGLFTCDEQIADDVTHLFNYLTGYSGKADYEKLLVAPVNLRARIRALIQREVAHVAAGLKGKLIFKMNSLEDPSLIRALYRASQAGVKIKLIVRGICCLRPGVPGVSDNIEVTSIVGRFLEHSRVYYFGNGGEDEIYVGSPDLMPRNLDRRVEIVFPVQDAVLVRRIRDEILATYLADTAKVRRMKSDGTYTRPKTAATDRSLNSQLALLQPQKR